MTDADLGFLPMAGESPWPSQLASLALHLGVMALLALLVPPPLADGETDAEDVAWMRHMLASAGTGEDDATFGAGAGGNEPAPDLPGPEKGTAPAAGAPHPPSRRATEVTRPGEDPRATRDQAAEFGMIGLLADPARVDGTAPSPWDRAAANGARAGGDLGALWGDAIGDAFGIGGIALSGVGEGGGGRGVGIDIGEVGGIGHSLGSPDGSGSGFGCGCGDGSLRGSHRARAPVLRCGPPPDTQAGHGGGCTATVNGRLPPEAVQRVIRQSFGRFRMCYEDGLRRDPGLEGRVSVRFVIDRQGAVPTAADAGSDLHDPGVVACVVRGFQGLSFPEPAGGIVTVVYPLMLSPG